MDASTETIRTVRVVADGVLYAIGVEIRSDDIDWLDRTLIHLTQQPVLIRELLLSFPIAQRLVENAVGRLLERNILLLDVHDGTVRASDLPRRRDRGTPSTLMIWQDHATGTLLPLDHVNNWRERSVESTDTHAIDEVTIQLRSTGQYRTPLEMSHAELLYRMQRFRSDIDAGARIRSCERVRRMPLHVRGTLRTDGRLAIMDAVPWTLRASWARSEDSRILDGITRSVDGLPLPEPWDEMVRRWSQEMYNFIEYRSRSSASVQVVNNLSAGRMLTRALQAGVSSHLLQNGAVTLRRLVREAHESVVICLSGEHGSVGDAVQMLTDSGLPERLILVSVPLEEERRRRWSKNGIRVITLLNRVLPDFVLIDSRHLILGAFKHGAMVGIHISSRVAIEGYIAWLVAAGATDDQGIDSPDASTDELVSDLLTFTGDVENLRWMSRASDGEATASRELASRIDSTREELNERRHVLEAKLFRSSVTMSEWMTYSQLLVVVRAASGVQRVIVRSVESALAGEALHRGVECAVWPPAETPIDCVVLDKVVIMGFAPMASQSEQPDFLALYDPELAVQLRLQTAQFGVARRA